MGNYPKYRKPASKVSCSVCGKIVHARGLPGHMRLAHGSYVTKVKSPEKTKVTQVSHPSKRKSTPVIQEQIETGLERSDREQMEEQFVSRSFSVGYAGGIRCITCITGLHPYYKFN